MNGYTIKEQLQLLALLEEYSYKFNKTVNGLDKHDKIELVNHLILLIDDWEDDISECYADPFCEDENQYPLGQHNQRFHHN